MFPERRSSAREAGGRERGATLVKGEAGRKWRGGKGGERGRQEKRRRRREERGGREKVEINKSH